jgi:hypothetical protein
MDEPGETATNSDSQEAQPRTKRALETLVGMTVVAGVLLSAIPDEPHEIFLLVALNLSLSQISLLAIWATLGQVNWLARLGGVCASMAAWSAICLLRGESLAQWALIWTFLMIALGALLLMVRSDRIRLLNVGSERVKETSPVQFTLIQLVIATTLVAAVSAVLRKVHREGFLSTEDICLSLGSAIVALGSAFAILGSGHFVVRMGCLAVLVPMVGLGSCWIVLGRLDQGMDYAATAIMIAIPLVALLAVLRWSGYRLVKHGGPQPCG